MLGCFGLMCLALLDTFLRLPDTFIWLLPGFPDIFLWKDTVKEFFYQISCNYQREGIEALFQISLVCALAGRFKYGDQPQNNSPFVKVLQKVELEPTISTGAEEETVLDRTPVQENPSVVPQKSQYRMLKEFGRIKTQVISPLEDSTVVPEISSFSQGEESQEIEIKIIEEDKTQDYIMGENDFHLELKQEDSESLENLACAKENQQEPALEYTAEEEEYQPIEIVKEQPGEEIEYTSEDKEEEEYQPIEVVKEQIEEEEYTSEEKEEEYQPIEMIQEDAEENPLQYTFETKEEEEYQPIEESVHKEETINYREEVLEKDLEDYEEELVQEEPVPAKQISQKTKPGTKKSKQDDIETEKVSSSLKNLKADTPKVLATKTKDYLEEDYELEKKSKKSSENQEKKNKKKSKKHTEEDSEGQGEQGEELRPLLGYIIPSEDLPKKIKRFKLDPEDEE